jgi:hypothetical protein
MRGRRAPRLYVSEQAPTAPAPQQLLPRQTGCVGGAGGGVGVSVTGPPGKCLSKLSHEHRLHVPTCPHCHSLDQARILIWRPRAVGPPTTRPALQHDILCGLQDVRPAAPVSHAWNCSGLRITGIWSCSSPTNSLASVMIIAHDLTVSPVCRSRHSPHKARDGDRRAVAPCNGGGHTRKG